MREGDLTAEEADGIKVDKGADGDEEETDEGEDIKGP
jgi:hypothetical protein